MSLYTLTPAIYQHMNLFLPCPGATDDSFSTRGMLSKEDIDGSISPALVALSSESCDKQLRQILFESVFRTIRMGKDIRTVEYKSKLEWMLDSASEVLETTSQVIFHCVMPDQFELARECLSRMTSLRKYTHASNLGIPPLFVQTLQSLPKLRSISFCGGIRDSTQALLALSTKLVYFELQLYQNTIDELDCLAICPRTVKSMDDKKPGARSLVPDFQRAIVNSLANVLIGSHTTAEVLYLDLPPWEREKMDRHWFEQSFNQAKVALKKLRLTMPRLCRLHIEDSFVTPSLLKELLAGSPFLTHLALSPLRKPELETKVPALPLLKRLNIFALECPSRFPVFYTSVLAGATLEHAYLNGITPLDLGDIFTSPGFISAQSLRTLNIFLDEKRPFRPYHLEKLARHCINLESFIFSSQHYDGEPSAYFSVLSRLPKLYQIEFDHPWDTSGAACSPLMIHDGKYIRSAAAGNFRVLSCRGNSMNEEIHSRIREDIDGCRPLYIKRFRVVARAHPSLQTIIWKPTGEVIWTWKICRDGNKIKLKDEAVIDFEGPPSFDEKHSAVMMTNL